MKCRNVPFSELSLWRIFECLVRLFSLCFEIYRLTGEQVDGKRLFCQKRTAGSIFKICLVELQYLSSS